MNPSRPVLTPISGIPQTAASLPCEIIEPSPPTVIMHTQPSPLSEDFAPFRPPVPPSSYFSDSGANPDAVSSAHISSAIRTDLGSLRL